MKTSEFSKFKERAIKLRKEGYTYGEIRRLLDTAIPKSTLAYWCAGISLLPDKRKRLELAVKNNAMKGRIMGMEIIKKKRGQYLKNVEHRIRHIPAIIKHDKDIAKLALAMLYLGEGSKTQKSSVIFGNSNAEIIKLFMHLMRTCYNIDERKFRCTLQCRDDQDIQKLEKFWSDVTGISLAQFYSARVDPRSVGKKSKKVGYKGVCRIDYFSAEVFIEIMKIIELVNKEGI